MRSVLLFSIFVIVSAVGRPDALPIRIGDPINLIPPATNADGRVVVFAAAVDPDGTPQKGTNIYVYTEPQLRTFRRLTNYAGDSTFTGVTSVAFQGTAISYVASPTGTSGSEEVHLLRQNAFGVDDRTLVTDKEGCIQPLCVSCFRACVGPVHLNADESKVLYAVARQQPFFAVNADGSGLTRLPIYTGSLAPSPQRVISRTGLVVFTSSAPAGPTFAAAATDVYVMNLNGTGVKQVTKFGNASFFASNATISAGAELIAFESNFATDGGQVNQIWVVNPDGSGLRRLSSGDEIAGSPSISADASVVTFTQGGQIKSVRTGGDGTVLALTKLPVSAAANPAVSDDGTQVVFTLASQSASLAAIYRIPTDSTSDIRSFVSIYAPHLLNANGVVNATGYGAPSPGSLISIYGANIGADELVQATEFPLPTSLKEVSLLVNGQPIPLLAVTPWQINAQLPQLAPSGTASFQVRYAGGALSPPVSVDVKSVSPSNFVIPFLRGNLYYPQAAAFHAGTRIVADSDHPAVVGEKLEIYGLGLGVTNPVVPAGIASPASPPASALAKPRLQIGGVDATVTFAGLTPGLAGVYQVNAIVPAGVESGLQSLAWIGPDGVVSYSSIALK
ncbi:MAG: hypothetical protein DMG57_26585 [Acidobacteria bacterium]|nr:MAG: hypothetical protein DMG57_26585 [Acidobacteriota bacterium]